MALPRDLAEQTDAVIEASAPERVNFNEAFLELLDAYIRVRTLSRGEESSIVFVTERVYEFCKRSGLIAVMRQKFPNITLAYQAPSTVRGAHPNLVIMDEVAEFEP